MRRALKELNRPFRYASADEPQLRDTAWLAAQWEEARRLAETAAEGAVQTIDEVQKVTGWSEAVKRLWDEDRQVDRPLRVVLLGSAALPRWPTNSICWPAPGWRSGWRSARPAKCAGAAPAPS